MPHHIWTVSCESLFQPWPPTWMKTHLSKPYRVNGKNTAEIRKTKLHGDHRFVVAYLGPLLDPPVHDLAQFILQFVCWSSLDTLLFPVVFFRSISFESKAIKMYHLQSSVKQRQRHWPFVGLTVTVNRCMQTQPFCFLLCAHILLFLKILSPLFHHSYSCLTALKFHHVCMYRRGQISKKTSPNFCIWIFWCCINKFALEQQRPLTFQCHQGFGECEGDPRSGGLGLMCREWGQLPYLWESLVAILCLSRNSILAASYFWSFFTYL